MLDRISCAIKEALDQGYGINDSDTLAVMVLEHMRDPTAAMLSAVKPRPAHWRHDDPMNAAMETAVKADQMALQSDWRAMIDAALS